MGVTSTLAQRAAPTPSPEPDALELSVVMPCLNEADTIEVCVSKALRALHESGVSGEVIVATSITFETAFASAPTSTSTFTTSGRSNAAANISAVWPLACSFALRSTLCATSCLTAATCPEAAANISGVVPVAVG